MTKETELLESPHVLPQIDTQDYDLTPTEIKAATMIVERDMTPRGAKYKRKEYSEIADELGMERTWLYRLRAKPEFQRFSKDVSNSYVAAVIPTAIARLTELADGSSTGTPSIKALEMLLQMSGLYNSKQTVEVTQQGANKGVSDAELDAIIAKFGDK